MIMMKDTHTLFKRVCCLLKSGSAKNAKWPCQLSALLNVNNSIAITSNFILQNTGLFTLTDLKKH